MALGSGNIEIDVTTRVDTSGIVREVAAAERRLQPLNLRLDDKGFRQPLGRISGDMAEFEKSLDASVARTLAFGAAVGVLNGVSKAFQGMVASAAQVEKALMDINVILNLSSKSLAQFSEDLFDVAKNTGQAFESVSDAAVELSRQGLGAEETLRRINDAMILTRLSGMDAAKSVETLTAAVNSFGSTALTTTELVNKLATVDAAFAVSTEDLANALARAGSTAQGAKVSLDELLAAVTSVQQITARGGSVIGNAFKSIFTRIQRSSVREALEEIGVATTDATGNIRNAIDIIKDYAGVYKTLSDAQRSYTDELVAGVFQINNFKALVKDLSSDYSIYDRALKQSNSATDEAIRRNEQLQTTLSTLINEASVNVKSLAASLGELVATPAIENLLKMFNSFSGAIANALEGEGILKKLLTGIGKFISGPGLIIITVAFVKLFKFITGQATQAIGAIFNIGKAKDKIAETESRIGFLLKSNYALYEAITNEAIDHKQKEDLVLQTLKAQNQAYQQQQSLISTLSRSKAIQGELAPMMAGGFVPSASRGFVPNFANGVEGAMMSERRAIAQGAGGASKSARPKVIKNFPMGKGKKQTVVANTDEVIVPNYMGGSGSAIFNKKMVKKAGGKPKGAIPVSQGFVPNFAQGAFSFIGTEPYESIKDGMIDNKQTVDVEALLGGIGMIVAAGPSGRVVKSTVQDPTSKGFLGAKGVKSIIDNIAGSKLNEAEKGEVIARLKKVAKVTYSDVGVSPIKEMSVKDAGKIAGTGGAIDDIIGPYIANATAAVSQKIYSSLFGDEVKATQLVAEVYNAATTNIKSIATPSTEGSIFEAAVRLGSKASSVGFGGDPKAIWDFEENTNISQDLKEMYFDPIGYSNITRADAKRQASDDMITDVVKKAYSDKGSATWMRERLVQWHTQQYKPLVDAAVAGKAAAKATKAGGFIPNLSGGFIPNFMNVATPGLDYMSRHDKAKIAIDDSSTKKSKGEPFKIYETLLDHWSVNQVRMPVDDVMAKFPSATANDRARANQLLILGKEKKGKVASPDNPAYKGVWPNIYDAVNRRTGAKKPEILRNEPDWPDEKSPIAMKAIQDLIWDYAAPTGATKGSTYTATESDESIADYIRGEARGSAGAGVVYARAGHALSEITDSQNFLSIHLPKYRTAAGLNIMDAAAIKPAGITEGTWANNFNNHYGPTPPLTIQSAGSSLVSGLSASKFPFKGIYKGLGQSFIGLDSPGVMSNAQKIGYLDSKYNARIENYAIHKNGIALSKSKLQGAPFYWDEDLFEDQINQWPNGTWAGSRTLNEAPLDFSNPFGEAKFGTKGPGSSHPYIVGKLLRHLIGSKHPSAGSWPDRFADASGKPIMGQTIPLGSVDLIKAVAEGFIPNFSEGLSIVSHFEKNSYGRHGTTLDLQSFFPKSGTVAIGALFKDIIDMANAGTPYTDVHAGHIVGPRIPKMIVTAKRLLDRKRAEGVNQPLMNIDGYIEPLILYEKISRYKRWYDSEKDFAGRKGKEFIPSQIGEPDHKNMLPSKYVPDEEKVLTESLRALGLTVDQNHEYGGFDEFDRINLGDMPLLKNGLAKGFIPNFQKLQGMGEISGVYDAEGKFGARSLNIAYLSSAGSSGPQIFKNLLKHITGAAEEGNPYTEVNTGEIVGPRIPTVILKAKKILDRQRASGKNIPLMNVRGVMDPPARLLKRLQENKMGRKASHKYVKGEEKQLLQSFKDLGLNPESWEMRDLSTMPIFSSGFSDGFIPNFAKQGITDLDRAASSYESIKTKQWKNLKSSDPNAPEQGREIRQRILNASHFYPLDPKRAMMTMYKDVLEAGDTQRPYTDIEAGEIVGPRVPSILVRAKEILDRARSKGKNIPFMDIDGFFEPTWLMGTIQRKKNESQDLESGVSAYYYPGEEKDVEKYIEALGANPESPAQFQLANSPLFTNGFARGWIPNFQLNKAKGKIASKETKQLGRDLTDASIANKRPASVGDKYIINNKSPWEQYRGSNHDNIATANNLLVDGVLPSNFIKTHPQTQQIKIDEEWKAVEKMIFASGEKAISNEAMIAMKSLADLEDRVLVRDDSWLNPAGGSVGKEVIYDPLGQLGEPIFNQGFIPNFADLYRGYIKSGAEYSSPILSGHTSIDPKNAFFDNAKDVDEQILARIEAGKAIRKRFGLKGEQGFRFSTKQYKIDDNNLNQLVSGVYTAGNLRKMRERSRWFAENMEYPSEDLIAPSEWEDNGGRLGLGRRAPWDEGPEYLYSTYEEWEADVEELEKRHRAHESLRVRPDMPFSAVGTKKVPLPLATKKKIAGGKGNIYAIPYLGFSHPDADGFSAADEKAIQEIFSPNLDKAVNERDLTQQFLENTEFAYDLAAASKNEEKAINAARQRGLKQIGDHMASGLVPNFTRGLFDSDYIPANQGKSKDRIIDSIIDGSLPFDVFHGPPGAGKSTLARNMFPYELITGLEQFEGMKDEWTEFSVVSGTRPSRTLKKQGAPAGLAQYTERAQNILKRARTIYALTPDRKTLDERRAKRANIAELGKEDPSLLPDQRSAAALKSASEGDWLPSADLSLYDQLEKMGRTVIRTASDGFIPNFSFLSDFLFPEDNRTPLPPYKRKATPDHISKDPAPSSTKPDRGIDSIYPSPYHPEGRLGDPLKEQESLRNSGTSRLLYRHPSLSSTGKSGIFSRSRNTALTSAIDNAMAQFHGNPPLRSFTSPDAINDYFWKVAQQASGGTDKSTLKEDISGSYYIYDILEDQLKNNLMAQFGGDTVTIPEQRFRNADAQNIQRYKEQIWPGRTSGVSGNYYASGLIPNFAIDSGILGKMDKDSGYSETTRVKAGPTPSRAKELLGYVVGAGKQGINWFLDRWKGFSLSEKALFIAGKFLPMPMGGDTLVEGKRALERLKDPAVRESLKKDLNSYIEGPVNTDRYNNGLIPNFANKLSPPSNESFFIPQAPGSALLGNEEYNAAQIQNAIRDVQLVTGASLDPSGVLNMAMNYSAEVNKSKKPFEKTILNKNYDFDGDGPDGKPFIPLHSADISNALKGLELLGYKKGKYAPKIVGRPTLSGGPSKEALFDSTISAMHGLIPNFAEQVSVGYLNTIAQQKRGSGVDEKYSDAKGKIADLKGKIEKEGFDPSNPLKIAYDPFAAIDGDIASFDMAYNDFSRGKMGRLLLTEGNHRLQALQGNKSILAEVIGAKLWDGKGRAPNALPESIKSQLSETFSRFFEMEEDSREEMSVADFQREVSNRAGGNNIYGNIYAEYENKRSELEDKLVDKGEITPGPKAPKGMEVKAKRKYSDRSWDVKEKWEKAWWQNAYTRYKDKINIDKVKNLENWVSGQISERIEGTWDPSEFGVFNQGFIPNFSLPPGMAEMNEQRERYRLRAANEDFWNRWDNRGASPTTRRGKKSSMRGIKDISLGAERQLPDGSWSDRRTRLITMDDGNVGQHPSYLNYVGNEIDFLESHQKGDAYTLFSDFLEDKGEVISGTINQNRGLKEGSKTNFEDLVYAFPQLQYRMKENAITTGSFIDPTPLKRDIGFTSLKDLKFKINKLDRPPFQETLQNYNVPGSDSFYLSNLKTAITDDRSKADNIYKNYARGLIPNFIRPSDLWKAGGISVQEYLNQAKKGVGGKYLYDRIIGAQDDTRGKDDLMNLNDSFGPDRKDAWTQALATANKANPAWTQWDVLKDDQLRVSGKNLKPGEGRISNYKLYRTLSAETAEKNMGEFAPRLKNALLPIAKKYNSNISFKVPGGLTALYSHNDSLVTHFTNKDAAGEIEKTVDAVLAGSGISQAKRPYDKGFDIKTGNKDQRGNREQLSFGQLIARKIDSQIQADIKRGIDAEAAMRSNLQNELGKLGQQNFSWSPNAGKAEGFIPNFAKGVESKKVQAISELLSLDNQWIKAVKSNGDLGSTMGLGAGGTENRETMPQVSKDNEKDFIRDLESGTGMAGKMLGGKPIAIAKGGQIPVNKLQATQKDIYASNVFDKLIGAYGNDWDKPGDEITKGAKPWLTQPIMISKGKKILDGHHRWATLYARDAIEDGVIGNVNMKVTTLGADIQTLLQLSDAYSGAKHSGAGTAASEGLIPNFADALQAAIGREKAALKSQGSNAKIYVDQDNRLKGPRNPGGLLVANKRDEPRSGSQGVNRAIANRMDPKRHGAARGMIPNFASAATGGGGGPPPIDPNEWEKFLIFLKTAGPAAQKSAVHIGQLIANLDKLNKQEINPLSPEEFKEFTTSISEALNQALNAAGDEIEPDDLIQQLNKTAAALNNFEDLPDEEILALAERLETLHEKVAAFGVDNFTAEEKEKVDLVTEEAGKKVDQLQGIKSPVQTPDEEPPDINILRKQWIDEYNQQVDNINQGANDLDLPDEELAKEIEKLRALDVKLRTKGGVNTRKAMESKTLKTLDLGTEKREGGTSQLEGVSGAASESSKALIQSSNNVSMAAKKQAEAQKKLERSMHGSLAKIMGIQMAMSQISAMADIDLTGMQTAIGIFQGLESVIGHETMQKMNKFKVAGLGLGVALQAGAMAAGFALDMYHEYLDEEKKLIKVLEKDIETRKDSIDVITKNIEKIDEFANSTAKFSEATKTGDIESAGKFMQSIFMSAQDMSSLNPKAFEEVIASLGDSEKLNKAVDSFKKAASLGKDLKQVENDISKMMLTITKQMDEDQFLGIAEISGKFTADMEQFKDNFASIGRSLTNNLDDDAALALSRALNGFDLSMGDSAKSLIALEGVFGKFDDATKEHLRNNKEVARGILEEIKIQNQYQAAVIRAKTAFSLVQKPINVLNDNLNELALALDTAALSSQSAFDALFEIGKIESGSRLETLETSGTISKSDMAAGQAAGEIANSMTKAAQAQSSALKSFASSMIKSSKEGTTVLSQSLQHVMNGINNGEVSNSDALKALMEIQKTGTSDDKAAAAQTMDELRKINQSQIKDTAITNANLKAQLQKLDAQAINTQRTANISDSQLTAFSNMNQSLSAVKGSSLETMQKIAEMTGAIQLLESMGADQDILSELKESNAQLNQLEALKALAESTTGEDFKATSLQELQQEIDGFVARGAFRNLEGAAKDSLSGIRSAIGKGVDAMKDSGVKGADDAREATLIEFDPAALSTLSEKMGEAISSGLASALGLGDELANSINQAIDIDVVASAIQNMAVKNAENAVENAQSQKELNNSMLDAMRAADFSKMANSSSSLERAAESLERAAAVMIDKNSAAGFVPNFAPTDSVSRALSAEKRLGAKRPVVDSHPSIGTYVRDAATQPNFGAVKRDHPEGLRQAYENSRVTQSAINANAFMPETFTPNLAPLDTKLTQQQALAIIKNQSADFNKYYKQMLKEAAANPDSSTFSMKELSAPWSVSKIKEIHDFYKSDKKSKSQDKALKESFGGMKSIANAFPEATAADKLKISMGEKAREEQKLIDSGQLKFESRKVSEIPGWNKIKETLYESYGLTKGEDPLSYIDSISVGEWTRGRGANAYRRMGGMPDATFKDGEINVARFPDFSKMTDDEYAPVIANMQRLLINEMAHAVNYQKETSLSAPKYIDHLKGALSNFEEKLGSKWATLRHATSYEDIDSVMQGYKRSVMPTFLDMDASKKAGKGIFNEASKILMEFEANKGSQYNMDNLNLSPAIKDYFSKGSQNKNVISAMGSRVIDAETMWKIIEKLNYVDPAFNIFQKLRGDAKGSSGPEEWDDSKPIFSKDILKIPLNKAALLEEFNKTITNLMNERTSHMASSLLARKQGRGEEGRYQPLQATGFIPNFAPMDSVSRALSTEGKMGAKRPVVDSHPSVGTYVRDAATQPNFGAVKRDHPEGLRQASKNSRAIQSATNSNGFVPNFGRSEEWKRLGQAFGSANMSEIGPQPLDARVGVKYWNNAVFGDEVSGIGSVHTVYGGSGIVGSAHSTELKKAHDEEEIQFKKKYGWEERDKAKEGKSEIYDKMTGVKGARLRMRSHEGDWSLYWARASRSFDQDYEDLENFWKEGHETSIPARPIFDFKKLRKNVANTPIAKARTLEGLSGKVTKEMREQEGWETGMGPFAPIQKYFDYFNPFSTIYPDSDKYDLGEIHLQRSMQDEYLSQITTMLSKGAYNDAWINRYTLKGYRLHQPDSGKASWRDMWWWYGDGKKRVAQWAEQNGSTDTLSEDQVKSLIWTPYTGNSVRGSNSIISFYENALEEGALNTRFLKYTGGYKGNGTIPPWRNRLYKEGDSVVPLSDGLFTPDRKDQMKYSLIGDLLSQRSPDVRKFAEADEHYSQLPYADAIKRKLSNIDSKYLVPASLKITDGEWGKSISMTDVPEKYNVNTFNALLMETSNAIKEEENRLKNLKDVAALDALGDVTTVFPHQIKTSQVNVNELKKFQRELTIYEPFFDDINGMLGKSDVESYFKNPFWIDSAQRHIIQGEGGTIDFGVDAFKFMGMGSINTSNFSAKDNNVGERFNKFINKLFPEMYGMKVNRPTSGKGVKDYLENKFPKNLPEIYRNLDADGAKTTSWVKLNNLRAEYERLGGKDGVSDEAVLTEEEKKMFPAGTDKDGRNTLIQMKKDKIKGKQDRHKRIKAQIEAEEVRMEGHEKGVKGIEELIKERTEKHEKAKITPATEERDRLYTALLGANEKTRRDEVLAGDEAQAWFSRRWRAEEVMQNYQTQLLPAVIGSTERRLNSLIDNPHTTRQENIPVVQAKLDALRVIEDRYSGNFDSNEEGIAHLMSLNDTNSLEMWKDPLANKEKIIHPKIYKAPDGYWEEYLRKKEQFSDEKSLAEKQMDQGTRANYLDKYKGPISRYEEMLGIFSAIQPTEANGGADVTQTAWMKRFRNARGRAGSTVNDTGSRAYMLARIGLTDEEIGFGDPKKDKKAEKFFGTEDKARKKSKEGFSPEEILKSFASSGDEETRFMVSEMLMQKQDWKADDFMFDFGGGGQGLINKIKELGMPFHNEQPITHQLERAELPFIRVGTELTSTPAVDKDKIAPFAKEVQWIQKAAIIDEINAGLPDFRDPLKKDASLPEILGWDDGPSLSDFGEGGPYSNPYFLNYLIRDKKEELAKRIMVARLNDQKSVENYEEWKELYGGVGKGGTRLLGDILDNTAYGVPIFTPAVLEAVAPPPVVGPGNEMTNPFARFVGEKGDLTTTPLDAARKIFPLLKRGKNIPIESLLSHDEGHPYEQLFAQNLGTGFEYNTPQKFRDWFYENFGSMEGPKGAMINYAPFGYTKGKGADSPGADTQTIEDFMMSWTDQKDKTKDRNASGFVPNFSKIAGEIAASKTAGYKTPVRPSQVKSINIPGVGKTSYNTQESVFKAKGMSQPFIRPPANSMAAKPYAKKVQKKFNFNPYGKQSADGFVPNFFKGPTDSQFEEAVKRFSSSVGMFERSGSSLGEAFDRMDFTKFSDASNNILEASKEFAVQSGNIKDAADSLRGGEPTQGVNQAEINFEPLTKASGEISSSVSALSEQLRTPLTIDASGLSAVVKTMQNIQLSVNVPSVDVNVQGVAGAADQIKQSVGQEVENRVKALLAEQSFGTQIAAKINSWFGTNFS